MYSGAIKHVRSEHKLSPTKTSREEDRRKERNGCSLVLGNLTSDTLLWHALLFMCASQWCGDWHVGC